MCYIRVFLGETIKQIHNHYHSWKTYISLLLWPVLTAISTYYVYQTFNIEILQRFGIYSQEDVLIFIFSGTMGYNCFWAMVQSARYIQYERENGTLEVIFLSPANRSAMVYGRAMGGIAQNIWMFIFFIILIGGLYENMSLIKIVYIFLAFVILVLSSVVWGGFINSLFLISRDSSFWFTLFNSPMELLSGVRIPINAFPMIIKNLSCIFPLTFCLNIIREIFIESRISMYNLIALSLVVVLLAVLTEIILHIAEKRNSVNGGFQVY